MKSELEDDGFVTVPTEGVKFDQGKLRYDLLPPEMLEEVALVLTYGAVKYTTEVKNEWDALLLARHVKELLVSTPTGHVVAVTRNTCGSPIPTMQNASVRTGANGKLGTQIKYESWQSVEKLIQTHVQETSKLSGGLPYGNTDSRKNNTPSYALKVAPSAVPPSTCTLTIVTTQGSLEVYSAPAATMDSAFWTTVWQGLSEHFGILRPQNATGERNWERGMAWSRPFGALMRHMWAWWGGEDNDPETGYSHLSHALCCVVFLSVYRRRGIGADDRHKVGGK